jgi:hypothetical protein
VCLGETGEEKSRDLRLLVQKRVLFAAQTSAKCLFSPMHFNRIELKLADKYRDLRLLLINYLQLYNIHLLNLVSFYSVERDL